MHKKFKKNLTKIKGNCQLGRKVVSHDSKSDLPLGKKKSEYCGKLKVKTVYQLPTYDFLFRIQNHAQLTEAGKNIYY